MLRPADFYKEATARSSRRCSRSSSATSRWTCSPLQEELRRTDRSTRSAAPPPSRAWWRRPVAAHLLSYGAIVREKALLRDLIHIATHIIGQSYEAKDDVETLLDDAERLIFRLPSGGCRAAPFPVRAILKDTFEHIERLYERKEHITGLATGFDDARPR